MVIDLSAERLRCQYHRRQDYCAACQVSESVAVIFSDGGLLSYFEEGQRDSAAAL